MICCFAIRMPCRIWYMSLWNCDMRYHVALVCVFLFKYACFYTIRHYCISDVACNMLHWCKTPLKELCYGVTLHVCTHLKISEIPRIFSRSVYSLYGVYQRHMIRKWITANIIINTSRTYLRKSLLFLINWHTRLKKEFILKKVRKFEKCTPYLHMTSYGAIVYLSFCY